MAAVAKVYPLTKQQPEPLWRQVLGSRLRALRSERGETLAETAERAGISPQYLSEIERGRKEPSSEMIAALAGALDTTLADLTTAVTEDLRRSQAELRGSQAEVRRTQPEVRRPAADGALLPNAAPRLPEPGMSRPAALTMPQLAAPDMPQLAAPDMPKLAALDMPQLAALDMPQLAALDMPGRAGPDMSCSADPDVPRPADHKVPTRPITPPARVTRGPSLPDAVAMAA